MAIDTNDRIAAVATVVTDGKIEVLNRNPFTARLGGIMLQTFVFEPADVTVVELFVPVARVVASAELDRWIARVAPKLFNIHVAARDIEDSTFVEVRSALIADGITVEVFDRALALLAIGAKGVTEELHSLLHPVSQSAPTSPSGPSAVSELPARGGRPVSHPVAFAGYL